MLAHVQATGSDGCCDPALALRRVTPGRQVRAASVRRLLRRLVVGILGAMVVVVGLLLVPLPGPGWAIVFAGFALLGTEYAWAERGLRAVRRRLAPAVALLRRLPGPVRHAVTAGAGAVGVLSLVLSLALLR